MYYPTLLLDSAAFIFLNDTSFIYSEVHFGLNVFKSHIIFCQLSFLNLLNTMESQAWKELPKRKTLILVTGLSFLILQESLPGLRL